MSQVVITYKRHYLTGIKAGMIIPARMTPLGHKEAELDLNWLKNITVDRPAHEALTHSTFYVTEIRVTAI